MRTIDADALYASIAKDTYILADRINSKDYGMFLIGIKEKIDNAPTIEPSGDLISKEDAMKVLCSYCSETFCTCPDDGCFYGAEMKKLKELPSVSVVSRNEYEALKRKWIEAEQRADYYDIDGDDIASGCVSAETKKWETCFSCPLSKGCPKIQGKSNDELEQYASEIPTDCPIAEPKHGEWITTKTWNHDGEPYCSNCDFAPYDDRDALDYCPNCGAKMGDRK